MLRMRGIVIAWAQLWLIFGVDYSAAGIFVYLFVNILINKGLVLAELKW